MSRPYELRRLAAWYRDFAERTENPVIWEGRLRTAEELVAEAERLEKEFAPSKTKSAITISH
jgi:hypothetical protein